MCVYMWGHIQRTEREKEKLSKVTREKNEGTCPQPKWKIQCHHMDISISTEMTIVLLHKQLIDRHESFMQEQN